MVQSRMTVVYSPVWRFLLTDEQRAALLAHVQMPKALELAFDLAMKFAGSGSLDDPRLDAATAEFLAVRQRWLRAIHGTDKAAENRANQELTAASFAFARALTDRFEGDLGRFEQSEQETEREEPALLDADDEDEDEDDFGVAGEPCPSLQLSGDLGGNYPSPRRVDPRAAEPVSTTGAARTLTWLVRMLEARQPLPATANITVERALQHDAINAMLTIDGDTEVVTVSCQLYRTGWEGFERALLLEWDGAVRRILRRHHAAQKQNPNLAALQSSALRTTSNAAVPSVYLALPEAPVPSAEDWIIDYSCGLAREGQTMPPVCLMLPDDFDLLARELDGHSFGPSPVRGDTISLVLPTGPIELRRSEKRPAHGPSGDLRLEANPDGRRIQIKRT
jgi:hypothetical protein